MKSEETNNGKKGGLLKGKPHYDKDGKPLGGIKAIVTDSDRPVELEGGEVIINKEASKKHWKELSRINQSAGNGVPISPPDGADEDPDEYKDGGKVIEFNPNHTPSFFIIKYAEKIKKNHPDVWKKGGNIFGNQAFENLQRVQKRGYWLDSEKWMYIKWRSYVARHIHDFRIEGVIAMLKWVDKVEKGWDYMKDLIEAEIKKKEAKTDKKEDGGSVQMKKGGKIPSKGTLVSGSKKLDYKKTDSGYEFVVSQGEKKHFENHSKTRFNKQGDVVKMTDKQFENYIHSEGFVNNKPSKDYIAGDMFSIKDPKKFSGVVSAYNGLKKFGVDNYFLEDDGIVFLIPKSKKPNNTTRLEAYINSLPTFKNGNIEFHDDNSKGGEYVYFKLKFANGGELAKGIKAESEHMGTAEKLYTRQITPKEAPKSIAKEHLKENPRYYTELSKIEKHKKGGSVSEKINPDDYNLVIYHEQRGNFMVNKNTIYVWLYNDADAHKKLESGEFDFAMFPPVLYGNVFGVPPLLQVWTKKYQNRIKGSNKLIGIAQGWYDENEGKLYIEMMTTNPKFRRKGVNSYMVKEMREKFNLSQDDVIFDKPTKEGEAFMKSKKYDTGGDLSDKHSYDI